MVMDAIDTGPRGQRVDIMTSQTYTVIYSAVSGNRDIGTFPSLTEAIAAARTAGAVIPRRKGRVNQPLPVRGHERRDDVAIWIEAE
jgi:hypothetical protein